MCCDRLPTHIVCRKNMMIHVLIYNFCRIFARVTFSNTFSPLHSKLVPAQWDFHVNSVCAAKQQNRKPRFTAGLFVLNFKANITSPATPPLASFP